MSRVGKKILTVPANVQLTVDGSTVKAKGPKGELRFDIPTGITMKQEGTEVSFERANDEKQLRALHGTTRAHIGNMVQGVSNGFTKTLNVVGVGFKVEVKAKKLLMSVGFSHPILVIPPDEIEFATTSVTQFTISGCDKQLVGEIASKIRDIRPPEPYKGKGINFEGQYIRRKAGKSAGK